MRRKTVLIALLLSSCSAAPKTGDPLVDTIVRKEGPLSECVSLADRGHIYKSDPNGPPGMMEPDRLKNAVARAAARKIAVDWRTELENQTLQTFGSVAGDRCMMYVRGPATSGNFAFYFFSSPRGERGAYAFEKSDENWQLVERVRLGYW